MRDKGQVCITDRGKGRWQLKFDATTSGKRVTRYVTIKGTRAEAEKELRKILVKRDEGTLPEPSQATLEQYLSVYLANALDRSPKTRERYEEIARHQIIPFIGHHKCKSRRGTLSLSVGVWRRARLRMRTVFYLSCSRVP